MSYIEVIHSYKIYKTGSTEIRKNKRAFNDKSIRILW